MRPLTDAPAFHPFRPLPFLSRPHLQTILASKFHVTLEPPTARKLVELPGGDRLALLVSTPPSFGPGGRTVVMIHGLCGCGRSGYLIRMARKLYRRGVRAVRMNLRGCGAGRGLAREPYHSGRSEDARAVLESLRKEGPRSPTVLVGFSLGGNIALKLAGELGADARELLEGVIAVCPPVDLLAASRFLSSPRNRIYERVFLKLLRQEVADRRSAFPDLPEVNLPQSLTVFEFDQLYTAPRCGFEGALDYYRRASSLPILPRIEVPCRILFSGDDPLVDSAGVEGMDLPPHIQVIRTREGGHLGFLGIPGSPGGFRWMDAVLLEWCAPCSP